MPVDLDGQGHSGAHRARSSFSQDADRHFAHIAAKHSFRNVVSKVHHADVRRCMAGVSDHEIRTSVDGGNSKGHAPALACTEAVVPKE